ncbi:7TM diverse intracellular signaling domain-containing protein [Sulfurimonas marina]|uniref:histidine kinase n=1 Tax=Sulfurimonas marina TaxID=2590551 RepID=A0A7M1AWM2_9BACT|nr:7TM diverse intracellular signaling domain-containing protein [Sulfurimonas marina]QOP41726.1 hypothetical protein FJR03_08240 [Sulfurimonas marina]
MNVTLKLLIILLFSLSLSAYDIDDTTSNVSLLEHSSIFLDHTNSLEKEEVLTKKFQINNQKVINLGIVPDTALWIKFTLKNKTDKPLTKIIEYANSETEDLLFIDGDKTIKDGMFHHRDSRDSLNPTFEITLQPFEEKTYFIKGHCKISTFVAKIILWNKTDFVEHSYTQKFYMITFFTIIVTLLLYNLMLFIFTRDIVYLYYILYLTAVIFFESIYLGVAQLYLFSNAISEFVTKATMCYIVILVLPMLLFTMEFLHTERFKKTHLFLKTYLYGLPIIALLSFDNFLFDLNVMLIFFPLGFLMVLSGFYALKNGTKEASIYLIGWTFVIISLIFSVIQSLGGYNIFEHFRYINEVAFSLEAFTFSIALAYRIRRLHLQKDTLNQKLIELQQDEQKRLQTLVEKQTHDLKTSLEEKDLLYKELQHRVKNNLAMVISLLQLQIHKTTVKSTKNELTVTCNRINSFAKLYELLHLSDDHSMINTELYFQNIIKNIKIHFKLHVNILYDIKYNIPVKDSIYCGLILNELITNSFKYAFNNEGTILVRTYKKDHYIYMSVEDNGKGYDLKKTPSLGLTIVDTLTQKQLRGTIDVQVDNGTKTIIKWKEES